VLRAGSTVPCGAVRCSLLPAVQPSCCLEGVYLAAVCTRLLLASATQVVMLAVAGPLQRE
jgi:hypothetical protein